MYEPPWGGGSEGRDFLFLIGKSSLKTEVWDQFVSEKYLFYHLTIASKDLSDILLLLSPLTPNNYSMSALSG